MVMSTSTKRRLTSPSAGGAPASVVWHDIECGAYRADLPFWHELAGSRDDAGSGPILEVGAGTGRVALELARAGHHVIALERDAELLRALSRRGRGLEIEPVRADARTFELPSRDLTLCIAPMQAVQVLGGSSERVAFLRRARAHLRPGGVLACAIVTALEPFDCSAGDRGPSAELARIGEKVYASRVTAVRVRASSILMVRERKVLRAGRGAAELASEREVIELARITPSQLEREGATAGLTPAPARAIAATEDHVGSTVVMLRA